MKKIKPVVVEAPKHRNLVTRDHLQNKPKSGAHLDKKKEHNKKTSRNFKKDKNNDY